MHASAKVARLGIGRTGGWKDHLADASGHREAQLTGRSEARCGSESVVAKNDLESNNPTMRSFTTKQRRQTYDKHRID
jgi:hypothetical protein